MILNTYTNVSNGRVVDKLPCKKIPENLIALVKSNYLGEFKTKLEIAKVKRNLGIVDRDTIVWSDITGLITDNQIMTDFMNNVPFDVSRLQETLTASLITTLQDAIVYVYGQNLQVLQYNQAISEANAYATAAYNTMNTLKEVLYTDGILPTNTTNVIGTINTELNTLSTAISTINSLIGTGASGESSINSRISTLETTTSSLGDSIEDLIATIGTSTDTGTSTIYGVVNTVSNQTAQLRENAATILALVTLVSTNTNAISSINSEFGNYYKKSETDNKYATKTDLNSYYNKTDSDSKYALISSLADYITTSVANNTYVKKSDLGGSDYNFVTATTLASTLSDYLEKNTNISITGLTSNEDSISLKKPFSIDTSIGALDPDLVVHSKQELLTLERFWAGMTVVVLETIDSNTTATLYILLDPDKVAETDYSGWRPESSMRFLTLTQATYDELAANNGLDSNIYYYIEETPIETTNQPVFPVLESDESDEDYNDRLEAYLTALNTWIANAKILNGYYMSAVWGQELENMLANKAQSSTVATLRVDHNNLNTSVLSLTTLVNTLNNTITSLTSTIETLSTTVTDLETRIEALEPTEEGGDE